MAFKNIFTIEDEEQAKILRMVASKEVEADSISSDFVQDVIQDMIDTSRNAGGLGLAAQQIGSVLRIIVLEGETPSVIINPRLVASFRKGMSYGEGCLSVPDERFDIKRAMSVVIIGLDEKGEPVRIKSKNKKQAFVIQHELDHLDGVLVCD